METQTPTCQCPRFSYTFFFGVILVVSIIGGVVGAFVNSYFINTSINNSNGNNISTNAYQAGGVDVSLKQKEAGAITSSPIVFPDDIRVLNGVVTEVGDNRIILDVRLMNISKDTNLNYRTVVVGAATKISKVTLNKKLLKTDQLADQPIYTPITLSGINKGSILTVAATENIKTKKEFLADSVGVIPEL